MNFFIDTEFIEGFHKPLFGKRRHFIDLISIGIVSDDGREYYAISNEFNIKDADKWVKENVLSKLPSKSFNGSNIQEAKLWKSNKQIAIEIYKFLTDPLVPMQMTDLSQRLGYFHHHYNPSQLPLFNLYGYYSDYDHVLLCSLFGTMMDLPFGFPMYTHDLKQMLDDKIELLNKSTGYANDKWTLENIKQQSAYPKETNLHNAMDDAKWNKRLYDFINSLK